MSHLILVPAYGRDYKTAAEVRAAWEACKDFRIASIGPSMGRYINLNDWQLLVPDELKEGSYIRYNRLTELTHIGTWEGPERDIEPGQYVDYLDGVSDPRD
jgi:hypothetical protein